MCSLDGITLLKLIPHIFRQEVYAGKPRIVFDPEDKDMGNPNEKGK